MAVLSYMVQNQYMWVSKAHTCHTMFKRTFKLEMYRLRGHRQVGHAPKCKCIYFIYFMTSCNEFSARKPLEHLTVCLWVHLVLKLQNSQYIFCVCQGCSTQPRKKKTCLFCGCWYFEKHFKKLTNLNEISSRFPFLHAPCFTPNIRYWHHKPTELSCCSVYGMTS